MIVSPLRLLLLLFLLFFLFLSPAIVLTALLLFLKHWAPCVSHSIAVGGAVVDDEFDAEDDDPKNYDSTAQFTEPIIKKRNKGLDLSQWREFVQSNNVSNIPENEKKKLQCHSGCGEAKDGRF